uniref:Galanin and GMAP prepropeptide n=1 Tax=Sus scrofa TaxID=9823 RepID=A0A8D1GIS8_PIG
MPRGCALLLASLLLAAALSATLGLGSPVKEKRGWTLNSAGYLLGPHAIDNHRSFHDKYGLAGKRELEPEDEARPGEDFNPRAHRVVGGPGPPRSTTGAYAWPGHIHWPPATEAAKPGVSSRGSHGRLRASAALSQALGWREGRPAGARRCPGLRRESLLVPRRL